LPPGEVVTVIQSPQGIVGKRCQHRNLMPVLHQFLSKWQIFEIRDFRPENMCEEKNVQGKTTPIILPCQALYYGIYRKRASGVMLPR
jgi:hypothetical protein